MTEEGFYQFLDQSKPIIGRYLDMMEDVLRRTNMVADVIDTIGARSPEEKRHFTRWTFDDRAAEEFCYCNFRMMCELISIGCLLAHGDFKGTRPSKLLHTYQADAIIRSVGKLHSSFFPKPMLQISEGVAETKSAGRGPCMTKDELIKLYWYCGERLHVGTADNILKHMARAPDMAAVIVWHDKFVRLLSHHRIELLNPQIELTIRMHAGETGGPVANLTLKK